MKTIYYHGDILTMAEPQQAAGVLTDGRKVLAVGEPKTLQAQAPEAHLYDLGGCTMMPAFIDAHSHFTEVATGMLQVSLDEADSTAAVAEKVQKHIRENGIQPGEWVQAKDYDHSRMPGGKNPTLAQLGAMAPDNPLVIQHKSGHFGLFNAKALAAAGISAETPNPAGGTIGRDAAGFTGYLEENAYFAAVKKIPLPGAKTLLSVYRRAQEKYLSYGITTIQEGMLVKEMLPLYRLLLSSDLLKVDLVAYPDLETFPIVKEELWKNYKQYDRHIKIGGIKIFLDGSPQGRTAWMETPYAGETDYRGYGTMTDEQVKAAMQLAAQNEVQLLAHCNGDAAAAQFLRCLAETEKDYPVLKTLRPVMIHAQLLRPDQMDQAKQCGAFVSFFAAHVYHWGDVHIKNFGLERAQQISAAASAVKHGVPFTFHQDSPVIEPDMLETVWCAVNRKTKDGVLLGPDECIPVLEALRAVTINAARQYGEEAEKGSIAPGKQADLILLSENPLCIAPEKIRDIKVVKTIKAE
ncbi:MAG: amidohydrolase [Oscillospiraceae bacterium]|jgi:predicted amidohydrolase YtcJ|nr:amidohydrolase [Oscillospiraceae bacterium]